MGLPALLHVLHLRRILAALAGAALAGWLVGLLAVVPAILISALLLVAASGVQGRLQSASLWWALVGATSGCLVATGRVLAAAAQLISADSFRWQRALLVLVLALAGALIGVLLGRTHQWQEDRHPRDLLRSVSGLTTGVFAAVVAGAFVHGGLDVARTLSSRLSTSLTILVFSLAAPAWLSHLLLQRPDGVAPRLPLPPRPPRSARRP